MNGTELKQNTCTVTAAPTTAVLGCFDGMHIGHAALFAAARTLAAQLGTMPLVVSFQVPPAFSFSGGGELLTDTEERAALFAAHGIPQCVFLDFPKIRSLTAEEFLQDILVKKLGADSAVCGYNFTFGKDRAGTADTLRAFFGNRAVVCMPVTEAGLPVSSSRIRREIALGNVASAARMLGRPFSVSGIPQKGRGDGTSLGFPTANLYPVPGKAVPAAGVYICEAVRNDGTVFRAVADAGFAPTMDSTKKYRIEAHLFGFSGLLYGEPLTVRFLERIRGEQHFSSPEELKTAIAADAAAALAFFEKRQ